MGVELANGEGLLGQFASNAGYSELIAAVPKSKDFEHVRSFFQHGATEDVDKVVAELKSLEGSADVKHTVDALISLLDGQDLAIVTDGTSDDIEKGDFELEARIIKLDQAKQMVFGWFSIVRIEDRDLTDTQGDIISPETIEDSAYSFVLTARKAGEMHQEGESGQVEGIGRLIESVVFTKEKQQAMVDSLKEQGIPATLDLNCEAWWGGFKVDNPDTWAKVTTGELRAWSIGGRGKRG